MGFKTGLLAVLFLGSGCAGSYVLDDDNALVVAPLEVGDDGHLIVNVLLNGEGPYQFALDTGASISVIFDAARERAGVSLGDGRPVVIQGMNSAGEFPTTTIDELRIGSATWSNARVAALPADTVDSVRIDGILGTDFLRKYAVGVSVQNQVVRLYDPSLVSEREYRGWSSVPLQDIPIGEASAAAFAINMYINDVEILALLDLGAGSNLMNWHTADTIDARPQRPEDGSEISGVVEKERFAAELSVHELRIENVYWRNKTFLISDFPIFEVLALDDELAAIIGPGLFSERDFVLDFERGRMLLGEGK